MAKVVRLFGKADSFDIEFSRKAEKWTVDIPPDLVDGVYAVQLTAIDELGEVAYWVGELYMCNGACCLKIKKRVSKSFLSAKQYNLSTIPVLDMQLTPQEYGCGFSKNIDIVFRKECGHEQRF